MAILTPQQLRKCHILEKMKLYLIRQLFQRTHILCCNYKPFLWCGVVKACVTVIWKLLKRCAFECCQHCVDTNYSECGHKLGSNSSLFGGWIYLTLLTHSQVERLMVPNLLSMFTLCLCSPDDDYKQERQGGSSTTSLSRGGCSWSSLGHLLSIPRLYW